MPCTPTTTRAANLERRNKAATARSENRRLRLGSTHFPFRTMKETFPSRSLWGTGGSGADIASPQRHNRGIVRRLGYDAMNKKAAIADEQDNVAFGDGVAGDVLNHERVPGHHRGQHAPARDAQAQSLPDERNTSPASSHFSALASPNDWGRKLHDLPLPVQEPCVGLILPHDRAVVTNTFSIAERRFFVRLLSSRSESIYRRTYRC